MLVLLCHGLVGAAVGLPLNRGSDMFGMASSEYKILWVVLCRGMGFIYMCVCVGVWVCRCGVDDSLPSLLKLSVDN